MWSNKSVSRIAFCRNGSFDIVREELFHNRQNKVYRRILGIRSIWKTSIQRAFNSFERHIGKYTIIL